MSCNRHDARWLVAAMSLGVAALAAGCASSEELGQTSAGGAAGSGGSLPNGGSNGGAAPAGAAGVSGRDGAGGAGGSATVGSGGSSGSGSSAGGGAAGASRDSGAAGVSNGGAGGAITQPEAGSAGAGGSNSPGAVDAGALPPDAAAPGGSLFLDNFEDGNLTTPNWIDANPDLDGMWSVRADQGNQVLTQATGSGTSDWIIAVSGDYRWNDQVVQARVRLTSAPGMVGIFARLQDAKSYYFLYVDESNIILRKRISSGGSSSSTTVQKVKLTAPITMGTWHVLQLAVVGATMTGYLDGAMRVSGPASELASGGIGVGTSGASADFDDVTVTRP